MDGKSSGGGGGGAGPAPFLLKTYEMVDDSITDEIVSWSSTRKSFVVWNPPEFARLLLPTFFKHNNFSSFIRQLNTYGFRKIDPERWEFANEDFVKDQKHLLKNINRKKPIHSHSNPQGSTIDPERAAFEEEIDKLTQQKTALEKSVLRFKHQQPGSKIQLEDLTQRVDSMEERQNTLLILLKKAVQDPTFIDLLAQKLESMDFTAYNKKRRLPSDDNNSQMVPDNTFVPQFWNVFHDDFANKLKLELASTVTDNNMVSHSTESYNDDGGSPQIMFSELCTRDEQITSGELPLAPEKLEVSDTGTSFTFNSDSTSVPTTGPCEIPSLHTDEETEGHISCQLNLSLASFVSQVNASQTTDGMSQSIEEIEKPSFLSNDKHNEADIRVLERNTIPIGENVTLSSSHDPPTNQVPATPQVPVNDVFWEQFLTEKPASLDVEEAITNFRKLQNLNL